MVVGAGMGPPNYSNPPPGVITAPPTALQVPKFPPQFPPAPNTGSGPPVIGPDGQPVEFDGKRLRKTMMRKTVD